MKNKLSLLICIPRCDFISTLILKNNNTQSSFFLPIPLVKYAEGSFLQAFYSHPIIQYKIWTRKQNNRQAHDVLLFSFCGV